MEIIDLYLLIYRRNEMPELIKYDGIEYEWNEKYKDYMAQGGLLFLHNRTPFDLDDTVEILEKENKIPEKLEMIGCNVKLNILGKEMIVGTDTPLVTETCIVKINEIIDYLKSKGDE